MSSSADNTSPVTPAVPVTEVPVDKVDMKLVKNNVRNILKSEFGVHIPPAKVTNVITKGLDGINVKVVDMASTYKTKHREYMNLDKELKACTDDVKKAELTTQMNALKSAKDQFDVINREKIRVSSDAMLATSMVCDDLLKSMVRFAFDRCQLLGGKQVDATHMHDPSASSLAVWPLICQLPSWRTFPEDLMPKTRAKKAKADATTEAPDAPAAVTATSAADAPADTPAVADASAEGSSDDSQDDEDKKMKFVYYAKEICNVLIHDATDTKYSGMRVNHTLPEYCHRLLTEFLNMLARKVNVSIHFNETKTLSDNLVYALLHISFAEHQPVHVSLDVSNLKEEKEKTNEDGTKTKYEVERLVANKRLTTADGYFERLHSTVVDRVRRFNKYIEDHPKGTEKPVLPPAPAKKPRSPSAKKEGDDVSRDVPVTAAVKPADTPAPEDKPTAATPATDKPVAKPAEAKPAAPKAAPVKAPANTAKKPATQQAATPATPVAAKPSATTEAKPAAAKPAAPKPADGKVPVKAPPTSHKTAANKPSAPAVAKP